MSDPSNSERPDLTPPPRVASASHGRRASSARGRSTIRGPVAIVVVALLAVLVWVVIGLPRWVEARRSGAATVTGTSEEAEGEAPVETAPVEPAAPTIETTAPEVGKPPASMDDPPAAPARATARPIERAAAPGPDPFAAAMTLALGGLERGDLDAARGAVEEAARHRPADPALADVRARIVAAETSARLATLRDEARRAEVEEDWSGAVGRYERALALDPSVRFARDGVERARARAGLAERMRFHVSNPERLSVPEVLDEAADVLGEAAAIDPAGPRHEQLLAALRDAVATARTTIPVVLESDARTEVSIYHVGRLGTFERHELELRPGRYTVVGTRRGYRDVRTTLVVEPGRSPTVLRVACSEEI